MSFLQNLFTTNGFMPHGMCYEWNQSVILLHVISDGLITASYYSIPLTLIYFARRRKDLAFSWILLCFAVFIVACGTTHLMEIINIWHPVYWLSGVIKAITAVASVTTAILLIHLVPSALAIPSPAQLRAANEILLGEIKERETAVERAEKLNGELLLQTRRLEESLASERKLALQTSALDQHAIVAVTDPQGKITSVNDKFCAISQYSREELIGQDHRLINSGYHPKEFIRDLWTTIASGKVWHGEIKNKAKDGSFYWVDTTIVPFLNDDGKPRQYVAIRTDVTERKQAEEAAALLVAIVNSSNDAIIGKDLNSIVTSWNLGAEKLLGYSAEEMIGQSITRLIPADRLSEEIEIIDRIKRGESVEQLETVRLVKGGRLINVSATVSPIRDKTGKIVGASKVFRDITERKRAEQEIRELNMRLEQRVAERTAELETANKELEAFSYSVSHDLRSPLRAVDGFSQAVLEDYGPHLPEEGLRYLRTIREGAQRMGALIDDLLRFSRLSRASLNTHEVNTNGLVRHVLEELAPQHAGRQVEIHVEKLPPCQGDPALLNQVWVNLISNAIKYTLNREHAEIEIGCKREQDENVYFVRDNGAGFDMKYANKLFGVFQRLHRADEFEGTGVGLAIVQRIIHRHGGRIWAEAAVDRGATFYFTLKEGAKS